MKGVSFSDVNEDPYVPGADVRESEVEETAVVEPAAAPATGWVCANCNTENSGNFCSVCGAKVPEAGWVCANCNTENSGNFCSNCGAKAPEAGWTCANCNTENEGNFCSNCGAKKP